MKELKKMPLHPLFIHFPIALLSLATIISFINLFSKKSRYSITLTVLLLVGMVFGMISYILGDSGTQYAIRHFGAKHVMSLVHLHETYAMLALISYGLATMFHLVGIWFEKYKILGDFITVFLTIVGFILLVVTGYLGVSIPYGK